MDDADRADSRIENVIADGIREARRARSLLAVGACHWFGETVGSGVLFCDKDCRDDAERVAAARMRNGVK